jgi:hypothetical protein
MIWETHVFRLSGLLADSDGEMKNWQLVKERKRDVGLA